MCCITHNEQKFVLLIGIPSKNFQSGSTIGTVLMGLAANFLQGQVGGTQQQENSGGGLDLGSIAGSLLGGMGNKQEGNSAEQSGLGGILTGILSSQQGKAAIGGLISQALGGNQKGKGLTNLASLLGGGQQQGNAGGGLGSIIGGLLGGM